ncbi:MAG: ParB N-terminal domain-containing protein [Betaproteobacteria bacterium]
MKVQIIPITDVIPYNRNPRKNTEAVAKVAGSLKEFGWKQPIVVDGEKVVIAGHTRLLAAQYLKMEQVPVLVADDLTDNQVKAYRLADNRVAQEAEWDHDLLSLELKDLLDDDFDIALTGFDVGEMESIFNEDENDNTLPEQKELNETFEVSVECQNELEQETVFNLLTEKGYKCRILTM